MQKDAPFIWGEIQENGSMSNPLILAHYDSTAPTFLEVDTSKLAIGAILSQDNKNGVRRPVCFASRALTPQEQILRISSARMPWFNLVTHSGASHAFCCVCKNSDFHCITSQAKRTRALIFVLSSTNLKRKNLKLSSKFQLISQQ